MTKIDSPDKRSQKSFIICISKFDAFYVGKKQPPDFQQITQNAPLIFFYLISSDSNNMLFVLCFVRWETIQTFIAHFSIWKSFHNFLLFLKMYGWNKYYMYIRKILPFRNLLYFLTWIEISFLFYFSPRYLQLDVFLLIL